jgi:hypothetical protein
MPDVPLYIVPVGIRYGNFIRFRSTVRVQIGEPINVGKFISARSDMHTQEQMNDIRQLLEERMRESIFYIPNDEDYEATYEVCGAVVSNQLKIHRKYNRALKLRGLNAYFTANNLTVKQIQDMKESDPERAKRILDLGREAIAMRTKENISLKSVAARRPILSRILAKMGILTANFMRKYRRHAIVALLSLAAIVTPYRRPDYPVSSIFPNICFVGIECIPCSQSS